MQGSIDIGGPFRNAILALAARRLKNRNPRPESVERTYWTVGEYQRDAARLAVLGYEVTSEAVTNPYVDRKSTRLNSSHQIISYAVFCLKKKKSKITDKAKWAEEVTRDRRVLDIVNGAGQRLRGETYAQVRCVPPLDARHELATAYSCSP